MTELDEIPEYIVQNTVTELDCTLEPLVDLNKYSGLSKVLRVTAWIQRFVNNVLKKERRTGELCTEEI